MTNSVPRRTGVYLAVLQLSLTLTWTVYAIYLPTLAARVGISAASVAVILMLDQAIFMVADFATGVVADRVSRALGRLGHMVAAVTLLSCIAFLTLPLVASVGAGGRALFIGLVAVWAVTSSALRAPPFKLLGKYAAKPTIPYLSSLAMLGYGIAGALTPYLAIALRDRDPRWSFGLSSLTLVLVSFALAGIERALAGQARDTPTDRPVQEVRPARSGLVVLALAVLALAVGFQMHSSINSASFYLRFAQPADLEWLMPIFWIGFSLAMVPAGLVVNRYGGLAVMGVAAMLGAAAILGTDLAPSLNAEIAIQAIAGAAWGFILTGAFAGALTLGPPGAEGKLTGVLFSALALATVARIAASAAGLPADPFYRDILPWVPTVCWILGGAALLGLAAVTRRREAFA